MTYPDHLLPDVFRRPSAFRAVSLQDQEIEADTAVKVFFNEEAFDLGLEYKRRNSLFVPRRDGVYLIQGTLSFEPDNFEENYRTRVEVRVNGNPYEAADNDFWGSGVEVENVVQVSAILQLEAGDEVEIYVESSIPGTIASYQPGSNTTSFSAAKLAEL
ncbi:ABC transporter permease [Rossellomorea vietnamensis]|uniref:ABC transporter permease n=1 Tax=Rossellomorea vietnamensis TaxID=218284 RepID=A0A5D4KCD0_9BACI|nr:ABC transporter permease [Rossellomorea vietnamensis]TYR74549.1 ABC transporter permease [Rossellomorea vietnamensis]